MLTLLTSGCSSMTSFKFMENELFTPAYWYKGSVEQQTLEIRQKIEHALAAGNLEQAHRFIVDSDLKIRSELQRDELYATVINRLLLSAEQARIEEQTEQEGRLFVLAKEIYPTSSQLQSTILLSMDEIDKNIQRCVEDLMKKGLLAYRSGDLESAINIWGVIGQFLSNHPPSDIAVRTTKLQLQNLEKLTSTVTTQP